MIVRGKSYCLLTNRAIQCVPCKMGGVINPFHGRKLKNWYFLHSFTLQKKGWNSNSTYTWSRGLTWWNRTPARPYPLGRNLPAMMVAMAMPQFPLPTTSASCLYDWKMVGNHHELGGGFRPTQLKNMNVKLDHFPRDQGTKNKNLWNHHLETHSSQSLLHTIWTVHLSVALTGWKGFIYL